jgi:hypothetical protein
MEEALEVAIPFLFGNEGERPLMLARQDPAMRAVTRKAVEQLE